jgi:FkbM family methyltransferase
MCTVRGVMQTMTLRERSWQLQKAFTLVMPTRERLLRLRLAANLPLARVKVPHGELAVDLRDVGVGRNIYRDRCYEPAETLALKRLTPAGGTVLDIGANLGYFTTLFAQTAGLVIAIEPNPETVALLEVNTAHLRNVTIFPYLAGDEDRPAALYLSPDGNAGDHQAIPSAERRAVPVSMHTVDYLMRLWQVGPVGLIKIDIQGYEVFALRGMREVLAANPTAPIVAEFWPLGLTRAGLTVDDWIAAFGPATFCRIAPDGADLPVPCEWFWQQPAAHYESLVV